MGEKDAEIRHPPGFGRSHLPGCGRPRAGAVRSRRVRRQEVFRGDFLEWRQHQRLDANKFFEELASRGVSSRAPIDAKKFFDELSSRGVNTQGIDPNKFFEELSSRGVKMPDMMVVKSTQ